MKLCLCAALMMICNFAIAEDGDQLLAALYRLQTQVSFPTEVDRAEAAAVETPVAVLALVSAVALSTRIPGVPWREMGLPVRTVVTKAGEAGVYAIGAGAALYLGAKIYRFWRRRRELRTPLDYHTPDGLRRFFASPIDEQYVIARRDPAFETFLIRLADGFTTLQYGFTPGAVTP